MAAVTRNIKTFGFDGEFIDDSHAMYARVNAEHTLNHMMRDKGYVKVLDLDPVWIVQYDSKEDKWLFSIRAYGVYVGKRKSWQYEGITQGKLIPRNTPQPTSNQ